MIANLASFRRIGMTRPDLRAASVAVCVLLQQDVPCLLITRRAAGLRNHAGQWALPGGSRPPDESAEEAALRELRHLSRERSRRTARDAHASAQARSDAKARSTRRSSTSHSRRSTPRSARSALARQERPG